MSSNATDNDISLSNGFLTLVENAITSDTVQIETTIGVSKIKISTGKVDNFFISTQTFTMATPFNFTIDENTNVTSIQMDDITTSSFTNSTDNIKILGGNSNDSITNTTDNVMISSNLNNDTINNSDNNGFSNILKATTIFTEDAP